ncbi:MAG: cyclic nucleotide-binding domain-containing protein [Roseibacillus sp.]
MNVALPTGSFLESLSEEERQAFFLLGEVQQHGEGETVIQETNHQDHLHILISGRAKVMQKHVAPAVTAWLEAGESFGEVNLFDLEESGASASVIAAESITVWRIDRAGLNTFIAQEPDASLRLMIGLSTLLSKRLRAMNDLVKEMSVWTHS